jgi:cation transport ATPase
MQTIDYTHYTIDELLDAKANIDSKAFSENYAALLKELEAREFNIEEYQKQKKELKFKSAEKRVKIVGVFQLLAVVIMPLNLLMLFSSDKSFSSGDFILVFLFLAFNGVAGWTAFKSMKKYYWLSILNQSVQLFSFAAGSVLVNYSGIGGIYAMLEWGEGLGFQFSVRFNPGFSFLVFEQPLPSGYLAIDMIAVVFIIALVTVLKK